jgi:pimeloyl-ACP methyl ester carboxylesterase
MTYEPLTAKRFHASRKFSETAFGRIAYVERGSGPAALFVHGALLNGFQWRHQLAGLSSMRRVIAPDSMAMGYTEMNPAQKLGMKAQAAMLLAFIDSLGLERVDLVGNDSGGGAAQILAAEHPERVRTLTLTDCEVHDYDESAPGSLRFRKAAASGALAEALKAVVQSPAAGRRAFASAYQRVDALPDEVFATYAAPLVASAQRIEQLAAYVAATTNKDLIAVAPQLRVLPVPALVLWGAADDFFPLERAKWLEQNLPHVEELVELPGARVFWPEEQPELLNRKLSEFWTRHASTGHA